MLTGTLVTDDRLGLVVTGVAGGSMADGGAARDARTERLTPRARGDVSEVFGSELNESSCMYEDDAPDAGRIEDQLGPPKTPWIVWMRCEEMVRAIAVGAVDYECRTCKVALKCRELAMAVAASR